MVDLVRDGTISRDMTEVQCAVEVQVELTGPMLLLRAELQVIHEGEASLALEGCFAAPPLTSGEHLSAAKSSPGPQLGPSQERTSGSSQSLVPRKFLIVTILGQYRLLEIPPSNSGSVSSRTQTVHVLF